MANQSQHEADTTVSLTDSAIDPSEIAPGDARDMVEPGHLYLATHTDDANADRLAVLSPGDCHYLPNVWVAAGHRLDQQPQPPTGPPLTLGDVFDTDPDLMRLLRTTSATAVARQRAAVSARSEFHNYDSFLFGDLRGMHPRVSLVSQG